MGVGGSKDLLRYGTSNMNISKGASHVTKSVKTAYLYCFTDNMCHVFKHLAIDCCLVSPSSAADPEIFPRGGGGSRDKGGGGY